MNYVAFKVRLEWGFYWTWLTYFINFSCAKYFDSILCIYGSCSSFSLWDIDVYTDKKTDTQSNRRGKDKQKTDRRNAEYRGKDRQIEEVKTDRRYNIKKKKGKTDWRYTNKGGDRQTGYRFWTRIYILKAICQAFFFCLLPTFPFSWHKVIIPLEPSR